MKHSGFAPHWRRKCLGFVLWAGLASVVVLGAACGYETSPAGYAQPSPPEQAQTAEPRVEVVGEGEYTEESFPYAHLFKDSWGAGPVTPYVSYTRAVKDAEETGAVKLLACFEEPFPLTGGLSVEEEQYYADAVSQMQDRILTEVREGEVMYFRKMWLFPCASMTVDSEALRYLITHADDLGITSLNDNKPLSLQLAQSVPLIGADNAWQSGYTGKGHTITILDTGVDKGHGFLVGKVVYEACYSTTDPAENSTSLCPPPDQDQEVPCSLSATSTACDHETHVAGIAGGKGQDFEGVAQDATIISIQVYSRIDDQADRAALGEEPPCLRTFPDDLINALGLVYQLRDQFSIAAANISSGGEPRPGPCDGEPIKTRIDLLRGEGIATVVSSGNASSTDALSYPACVSTAVSVGATDDNDDVLEKSNSADYLDLLAPGADINSSVSVPVRDFRENSGTSMAAPHVAGAWAVMKQKLPKATVDEILTALKDIGVPVLDNRNNIAKPRIQLDDALDAIGCGPPVSGDWYPGDCTLTANTSPPANVVVWDNGALTLADNVALDVDFSNHHLRIRPNSKVVIKLGAKVH